MAEDGSDIADRRGTPIHCCEAEIAPGHPAQLTLLGLFPFWCLCVLPSHLPEIAVELVLPQIAEVGEERAEQPDQEEHDGTGERPQRPRSLYAHTAIPDPITTGRLNRSMKIDALLTSNGALRR